MENFLISLPSTLLGWLGLAGFAVVGAVAVYGLWDKNIRDRKKQSDESDDRLISLLQETVTTLEKKVDEQKKQYDEDKKKDVADKDILVKKVDDLTREVHDLKKDNEKYVQIFQGRDEETKNFYKAASESMQIVHQTHDVVTTLAQSIENTNTTMSRLIDLLEKHLDVIDHAASK